VLLMLITLAMVAFAGVALTGFLRQEEDDRLLLVIDYPNHWNATVTENGVDRSLSGFGKVEKMLLRPDDGVWSLTIRAWKLDDSTNALTVTFKLKDGTLLRRASTVVPYGTVEISADIV
jgi:hypothetical protein